MRIFVRCATPLKGRRGPFEIYSHEQYVTVTGWRLPDAPATLAHCNGELTDIVDLFIGKPKRDNDDSHSAPLGGDGLPDDAAIIEKASAASNGDKFSRLFDGDTAGYPGPSEADAALCAILAFWCGRYVSRIDALFRKSKLMRDKWDEKHSGDGRTYGQMTIDLALKGRTEFYEWKRSDNVPLSNGKIVPPEKEGRKPSVVPMTMNEIIASTRERTGDWPRRIDNAPFVHDGHGISWFAKAEQMFGWLTAVSGTLRWHKGVGFRNQRRSSFRTEPHGDEVPDRRGLSA